MTKKKTHNLYPIVEVVWTDAIEHGDIGWNNLTELMRVARKPCPVMRTVGYCIFHGVEHIAVLNTLGSEECSRLDKIPFQFVQDITYLRGEPPVLADNGPKSAKKTQK